MFSKIVVLGKGMYPLVSVVILNWNGVRYIRNCIESVLATDYPNFEVIVVDNASTDGSKELIKTLYPQVKLIENRENLGWCDGNNIGIKESKGDIIVLLNNDTVVDRNWIKEIINEARKPDVGIIGCRLYFPNSNVIQSLGFRRISLDLYENIGAGQIDDRRLENIWDVDYVSGAALAVKREVLVKIGLLDSNFHAFSNDVDLCLRVRKAGYRVVVSRAKVYHYGSASWNRFPVKKIFFSHKDRLYFILKHYGLNFLPKYVITYLILSFKIDLCRFLRGETVLQRLAYSEAKTQRRNRVSLVALTAVILRNILFLIALFSFLLKISKNTKFYNKYSGKR